MSQRLLPMVLAACVSLWAGDASPQEPDKVPVVGVLLVSAGPNDTVVEALRRGLRELGYVDGRNIKLEHRGAKGDVAQLPRLAQELVELRVAVIVSGAEPAIQAAKQMTNTIPIVFALYDSDPTISGLVESLSRPGGNVTGVFSRQPELAGKRLELIKETLPHAKRVAVLWEALSRRQLDGLSPVAKSLGIQLLPLELRPPHDYDAAFKAAKRDKVDAALVLFSPNFYVDRTKITRSALKHKLATISQESDNVVAGGLMSYGPTNEEMWGRAAYFIDRLLKGARPSDLPVEQISTPRLTLNLKTAKTLGLRIPESVLLRADEVIR